MKIGDSVWSSGHLPGKWKRHIILDETSRSWVVAAPGFEKFKWARGKVPKSEKLRVERGWALSLREARELDYVHDNRHKIADMLRRPISYLRGPLGVEPDQALDRVRELVTACQVPLPCPVCRNRAALWLRLDDASHHVCCSACKTMGPVAREIPGAVAAWNRLVGGVL